MHHYHAPELPGTALISIVEEPHKLPTAHKRPLLICTTTTTTTKSPP